MASSVVITANRFSALPVADIEEKISHPQRDVPKKNRRQRQKAAAAKSQVTRSADPAAVTPSSTSLIGASAGEKPKNWKASLSMAKFKILEAEEARKKHEAAHPSRPKAESKDGKHGQQNTTATKGSRGMVRQNTKTAPVQQQGANDPQPRPEHLLPPCGIRGCPITADHERRPYASDEPNR